MDALLDKAFHLDDTDANVEVGKFTVLILDGAGMTSPSSGGATLTGTYGDGCRVPGGANDGPIAGVAQESILPSAVTDYSGGQYQITSGTAWPANSIPSSAKGRAVNCRLVGISRCVAASAVKIGDDVNIADNQGRIKTVNETTGTLVYVLGKALDSAGQANDVIRVLVMPYTKKA